MSKNVITDDVKHLSLTIITPLYMLTKSFLLTIFELFVKKIKMCEKMEMVGFLLLVLSQVDFYESGENESSEKAGGNIYTFRSVVTKAETARGVFAFCHIPIGSSESQ